MKAGAPTLLLVNPDPEEANSISLGYIAAYCRQRGFGAEVLDFGVDPCSIAELERLFESRNVPLVGISSYQSPTYHVLALARLVKRRFGAKVVLGGPQAGPMPDAGLAAMPDVDYLCRGEGEDVALALMQSLAAGGSGDDVAGISYKSGDGTIRTNPKANVSRELDQLPSPYLTEVLRPKPGTRVILLGSRGCPFACSFCVTPFMSQRRMRYHSPQRIAAEIAFLHAKGLDHFWFADPLFTANRARVIEVLRAIGEEKLDIRIDFETRAELIDDEMLGLMKKVGVELVSFGLETADQEVLDKVQKKQDITRFNETLHRTKIAGIDVELLNIIDLPGVSCASALSSFDYVRSLGLYFWGNTSGQYMNLYFGTEIAANPEAWGLTLTKHSEPGRLPPFLSPGRYFTNSTLSSAEYALIEKRRSNETRLAEARDFVRLVREGTGLSADDVGELPWSGMQEVRKLYRNRQGMTFRSVAGPIEQLVVVDRPGAAGRAKLARTLSSLTRELAQRFTLTLLGADDVLLLEPGLVKLLREALSRELLYSARLVVGARPAPWIRDAEKVRQRLRGLEARSEIPVYDLRSSFPAPPSRVRPLMHTTALLDVTEPADQAAIPEAIGKISGTVGLALFPFHRFDTDDAVDSYLSRAQDLARFGWPNELVVVGLAEEGPGRRLEQVYARREGPMTLPVLHLLGRDTLVHGGRIEPPAAGGAGEVNARFVHVPRGAHPAGDADAPPRAPERSVVLGDA